MNGFEHLHQRHPLPSILPRVSEQGSPAAATATETPRAKRTRGRKSCDSCRKKIRCNGGVSVPCSNCKQAQTECRFSPETKKRGPVSRRQAHELTLKYMFHLFKHKCRYVHELEARLSRMEALLEKYASGEQSSGSSSPHRSDQNELVTAQNLSSGVSQQFDALTLADYARTKYIGISAGVHLLDDDVFRFKRRVKLENRGILQKVNDDEDEHVLVRSQVASHPPVRPSFEYHRSSLFSEDLPQMTVELADHLVEL